jgi:CRISPR/Cas system-associated endonuclease/helicase Cas3
MNTKEFVQAIRQIIKEEVQKTVKREIQVLLSESKTIDTSLTDIVEPRVKVQPRKPQPQRTFSKNPVLNEILNSTAPMSKHDSYIQESFMQETVAEVNYNDHSEWPTMRNMSGMSNKIGVASMLPTTDTEGRPLNNVHVPEEVANALTKDYSALMKAINKKKGN